MSEGVLYVEILPSTKGIGKAVEGDLNKQFKNAEKTGEGFFSRIGKWAKGGALAIGGMVAGVAALAVTGGISRALNIEDAQAKLKGLGHDTQSVEAIMKDALASVKGTAFGLDAAATTAAAAVASGIKPGKELEGYLRLTADAATIAGVSMEEMGSIMNKVQAKGKAQMEDLNRLTERGIPIMQMLADEYGVTAEEMSKMVSKGEVDAERFRAALEKNLGGAALESGNTTRGAFANMRAALSRLGLVFVGDGLAGAKTFFNEMTVIFDGLGSRIGPWVEKIQAKLGGMFNLDGMGENFLSWVDETFSRLASGPIPQLLSALAPILPALTEMAGLVGAALGGAFKELGAALQPVLPLLAGALADAVVQLAPSLTELLVALVPLIPSLVELAAAIIPLIPPIVSSLIPALQGLTYLLVEAIEAFKPFIELLTGGLDFSGFIAALDDAADAPGTFLRVVLDVMGIFQDRWNEMVSFFTDVSAGITATLTIIGDFFRTTWETIGLVLGGALQVIVGLVTGNMQMVQDGIAQGLNAIRGWWESVWGSISGFLGGVWVNISGAVSSGINSVVSFMQSLPGRIMGAVAALPGLLVSVGRQMIQGLINGVSSMIQNAVNAVRNVGGAMLDGVKSFLGIKSPSRVFRDEVGKMVGLGLLEGIGDQAIQSRIDSQVRHLVEVPDLVGAPGAAGFHQTVTVARDIDPVIFGQKTGRAFVDTLAGSGVV